jgi:hypothetical protein
MFSGPIGLTAQQSAGTTLFMVLLASTGACIAYARDSSGGFKMSSEKTHFGLPNSIGNVRTSGCSILHVGVTVSCCRFMFQPF